MRSRANSQVPTSTLLATTLFPSSKRLGADISTPLASEDAQKHRPDTTAAVSTFSIILHVAAHTLPSTVAFISITVAAAITTLLRSSQLGARLRAKAALGMPIQVALGC